MSVKTEKPSKNPSPNNPAEGVIESRHTSDDQSENIQDEREKFSRIHSIFKTILRVLKARKRPIFYSALALSLLLVAGGIYLKWASIGSFLKIYVQHDKFSNPSKVLCRIDQKEQDYDTINGEKDFSYDKKKRIFSFKYFIIPLKKQEEAYVSMDISFSVYDNQSRQIIIDKRNWIRALIYDIVRKEINVNKAIPLLKNMKIIIGDGIIGGLPEIKIDRVYITNFSVV